ncbi:MAG: HEAT repeat domain-containing protein [Spirulinaceae cyanobacterium]
MEEQDFERKAPSGGELTVEKAIANLLQKEDLGLRYYAAWWLGRFRVKDQTAIDALLLALKDEEDRAPDGGYPLRRNAARALGKLGNEKAILPLIKCLASPDFYVREAAAQALEMLGAKTAIPHLRELLSGGVEAAQQFPGKPHLVQPYEAIIEALGTLKALEAQDLIKPFLEHFAPKVRFAAARAMYQLTETPFYGEFLIKALDENNLQLRRSALMDLGAIGYLPAGEAIAATKAENSLKLISLKGLLEFQLKSINSKARELSPESLQIMELMDRLL